MNELAEAATKSRTSPPQVTPPVANRRYMWWTLLAASVIGLLLRIDVAQMSGGLWPDELFSLAVATGHSLEHPAAAANPSLGDFVEPNKPVPAEEFRRYLRHDSPAAGPARVVRAVLLSDTNPPLYYLLLYGWTRLFGTSDLVLRLLSTTCWLACLPLIAAIARRTGGKPAVIPACVLFALSPLAIYYSTEGRMYSLLWLCVLATTWASLQLQRGKAGVGIYGFWIAASAAGFLTHYFFVFPWFGIVAFLLLRPGKLGRLHLLGCLLLTAALIAPWYVPVPETLTGWRVTKDWLKWRPLDFNYVTATRDIVFQFFCGYERHLWADRRTWNLLALILFAAVAAVGLWKMRRRVFARSRLLVGMVFAAACAGPLVFDLLQHTYAMSMPRYAIAALPAAYLLAGAALGSLGRRVSVVALCLIVIAWTPNLFTLHRQRLVRLPMREIAQSASADDHPSDLILVHSIPSGVLGVARYADGPAPIASWVGQLGNRQVPESLRQLTAGRSRILFVKVHPAGAPAPEEDWLRANATAFSEAHVGSGLVVDFRPRNRATF